MFKSARIKLTMAYMLIVVTITIVFSFVVYINVSTFTERALNMHENRVFTRLREFRGNQQIPENLQKPFTKETLEQIQENAIYLLFVFNLGILTLSGIFSYWFAGRTLKPIEDMTNKQKKFVADAAHELKTPLTAIKTHLEVNLRNKNLTLLQTKQVLNNILNDVDSLTLLINSLLKQSKFQDEHISNFEFIDLEKVIYYVSKQFADKLNVKNINLILNIHKLVLSFHG